MITNIEDYYIKGCGRCDRFETPECSSLKWSLGQVEIRRICLDMGLKEEVKWGHPCYTHNGRNIAIMGALINEFRLNFFNAALMKDPEGVLEKQGEFTRHADSLKFTDRQQVLDLEPVVRAYLKEAIGYADAGIKPPKDQPLEMEMPEELIESLEADPELFEAFYKLTPGRQRSYLFNLNAAKKPETRYARIEKFRDQIIDGKGAMER